MGHLDRSAAKLFEGYDVMVRVGPFEETLGVDELKWNRGRSELGYRGKGGGIVRLKMNFSKGLFLIAAKNIELQGLSNPFEVVLRAGETLWSGHVDRLLLNGGRVNPLEFMAGVSDEVVVASVRHRSGKASASLVIKG